MAQFYYDISNPVHYTVANNYAAVCQLIAGKYRLPVPGNAQEAIQACDVALNMYGEQFANDLAQLHPDKDVLLSACGHYGNCCGGKASFSYFTDDGRTLEQLQAELANAYQLLAQNNFATEADKKALVDKIEALKALIIQKNGKPVEPVKAQAPAQDNTNKQLLIFGIIALSILALSKK